jgi:16S rRNA (guanine527-N7)-methyltransferase
VDLHSSNGAVNLPGLSILIEGATTFGLSLSDRQVEQFARYQELLLAWNKLMNLTAITEPAAVQTRHFLDSLSCFTVMGHLGDCSLIDIGTGAGFPGLPLKIINPEIRLTLVDSVTKKTRFLQEVVSQLDLNQVKVVTERAEVLGRSANHRGQYDWVVARAVAEMRVLVEYMLPLGCQGGRILAQKGKKASEETAAAVPAIELLGGGLPRLYPIELPLTGEVHYLVLIDKVAETPAQYPRRPGISSKRPL